MNPKFIIVLQNNLESNQEEDPSLFDHLEIQNVHVKINYNWYTNELEYCNIGNENYVLFPILQDYQLSVIAVPQLYENVLKK